MTWIKKVYLYLVSLVSLIVLIVGVTMLVNMGLKALLHADQTLLYPAPECTTQPVAQPNGTKSIAQPVCDPNYEAKQQEFQKENTSLQKRQEVARSLAMIIVALPVFLYHWKLARKEA